MEAPVLVEITDDIALVTLNRPESRNPLDPETQDALIATFMKLDAEAKARVAILTGAGSAFCAGGNVRRMGEAASGTTERTPAQARGYYRHGIQRLPRMFEQLEIPVIAAVNGPAMGAGCDLTCMCDLRIAGQSARFAESFVKLGIIPGDGGAWLLPRVVGFAKAAEMSLTGDALSADQALAYGLVSQVVPDAELGEAMRVEYKMIVDAGFLLQVDDPFLSDICYDHRDDPKMLARKAGLYVESINHALRGIPAERVRFHTCYGINDGPRLHEAALIDVIPYMLKINAQAFSFEAGNVRHEHEYHLFENVKLQPGQILIPGVITHASNIIEHPELVAERIIRFADRVGRENVIAGADCGFSSQATYKPEVNPKVMWEKFKAMTEGARIASKKLWAK